MRSTFPALDQFFGGYFHQDYAIEYGDPDRALGAFLREASRQQIQQVLVELRDFMVLIGQSDDKRNLLRSLARCDYDPTGHGVPISTWLNSMEAALEHRLQIDEIPSGSN